METPKIRFKDDNGQEFDKLNSKTIKDLFNYKNGYTYEKDVCDNGLYNLISLNSIDINGKLKNTHKKINNPNWFLVKNDIVIVLSDVAHGDFLGLCDVIKQDNLYVLNQRMGLLRKRESEKFVIDYVRNYINNKQEYFKLHGQGSSQKNLSKNDIENFEILLPCIEEQEKIANFLSKVDKKLENQKEIICSLENIKKGLVQKIFNQEIRFKDYSGMSFPKWEKINLSKILLERKEYSEKNLEYPHVTLSKDGIYDKGERYDRDFLVTTENKKYKITKYNDICYNPANLKFGVICRNNYGNAIFSPIYVTFEVQKNNNPIFVENFLIRKDIINLIRKYEEGTVYERMGVKPEDFLKYNCVFPSLQEQEKIANFLSKIDEKIENEKRILEHLENAKKGLLQQMFV